MAWVTVRGIVVHGEAARGRVRRELGLGERQERSHQAAPRARGDAGQTRRRATPQEAEDDRLELVAAVMGGHEVAGTMTPLAVAEPGIARPSGGGLGRVRAKVELAQLERQRVPLS